MRLVDAHIHVDRLDDPRSFAAQANDEGIGLFSNTLVPQDFEKAVCLLGDFDNVRIGVGLHPWWVSLDEDQAIEQSSQALALLRGHRYVGEIGLDASPSHLDTFENQVRALRVVLEACAREGDKIISLHCVKAHDVLFQIMRETGVANSCTCILHWFSGNHEHLLEAIRMGCWFSVGERMLATKRGRAYVQSIPSDRLLLETDAPPVERGINEVAATLELLLGSVQATCTAEAANRLFGFE